MAYRLEREESVIAGLRRIVRAEIDSAETLLSGEKPSGGKKLTRDKAIHESRKSIKKVRALVRLVSPELTGGYARENARLRDIARRLSEFRDAFAMVETLDDLKVRFKKQAGTKLGSIRTALAKQRISSRREEDVALVLHEAASALRKASKRVKAWPLPKDGYSVVSRGLEATYSGGRKALARVQKNPSAEGFHELRKRVKDHWYHIRLLENLWSELMHAYEKSLKDLEDWLGIDHNLAVLLERVTAQPALYGEQKQIDLLAELIGKYQAELREHALAIAIRVYEDKPRDFSRRMKHLWETWHGEPKGLEESPTAA